MRRKAKTRRPREVWLRARVLRRTRDIVDELLAVGLFGNTRERLVEEAIYRFLRSPDVAPWWRDDTRAYDFPDRDL